MTPEERARRIVRDQRCQWLGTAYGHNEEAFEEVEDFFLERLIVEAIHTAESEAYRRGLADASLPACAVCEGTGRIDCWDDCTDSKGNEYLAHDGDKTCSICEGTGRRSSQ